MALPVTNNPQVSSYDISNFQNNLMCPVMFTPLTDAVLLTPCGHTISKVAADKMYQGIDFFRNSIWLLKLPFLASLLANFSTMCSHMLSKFANKPAQKSSIFSTKASFGRSLMDGRDDTEGVGKPCPLCRREVKAYFPNLIVQSIVNHALKIKPEDALLAASTAVTADSKRNLDSIQFPGKGAHFVHTSGDWSPYNSGGALVKHLTFLSATPLSLFQEMSIFGYNDGSVSLSIKYDEKDKQATISYLKACGIIMKYQFEWINRYISNSNDTKLLFNIIAKHNEIPEDKFPLIRDLVASGDWRTVTLH